MTEPFDLPVTYKGEKLHFPAQLTQFGYLHMIVEDVHGQEVFLEPAFTDWSLKYIIVLQNTKTNLCKTF